MSHRTTFRFTLLFVSLYIYTTKVSAFEVGPFEVDFGQTLPKELPDGCSSSELNSAAECICFILAQAAQSGDQRLEFCERVLKSNPLSLSSSCDSLSSGAPSDSIQDEALDAITELTRNCLGDINPDLISITYDPSAVRIPDLPNLSEKQLSEIGRALRSAIAILKLPIITGALIVPLPPITYPPPTSRPSTGGGSGDPHMVGFDGSHFSFMGIQGRHYAIFGRQHGDLLVSSMRGVERGSAARKGTYFNSFGLQVPVANDFVRVSIAPHETGHGAVRYDVTLQGERYDRDVMVQGVTVTFLNGGKTIEVGTVENTYQFFIRALEKSKYHLDLGVKLIRPVSTSDHYYGVLGLTLNRGLGHMIREELQSNNIERSQRAMRKYFEVSGLFPVRTENEAHLSGVSRQVTETDAISADAIVRAEIYSP